MGLIVKVVTYGVPLAGAELEPSEIRRATARPKMRHFVGRSLTLRSPGGDVIGLAVELSEGATISGVVELPNGIARILDRASTSIAVRWNREGTQPLSTRMPRTSISEI